MLLSLFGLALATHVTTFDLDPLYTKPPISGLESLAVDPAAALAQLKPVEGLDLPTAERVRNEARPREKALVFTNPANNMAEVSVNGVNLGILGPYATLRIDGLKSGDYHVALTWTTGFTRDFVARVGFVPPGPKPVEVKLTAERIEISDKIYFDFDSADILPQSHGLLDAVAATLAANPQVELVRIEGHTDSQGDGEYNRKLSQARAESVRAYLVTKGIDGARLNAAGFGESRPLDPEETEAAWEKNRRVEFLVEKMAAPEPPPEPAKPAKKKGK